jgi:hypothetical protein
MASPVPPKCRAVQQSAWGEFLEQIGLLRRRHIDARPPAVPGLPR